nr:MAG: DNA pilot protein [Microvirus sp.]
MAWNQDFGEGANPGSGYAQQSWRDSFNGGKAAGDWTGNHNARIDAERDVFQGTTWTGSSTQPSALALAQSFVGSGPGRGSVASGSGPAGTGPGNPVVTTGPTAAPRKPNGGTLVFGPGTGPGMARVLAGDPSLLPENKKLKRIGNGGPFESHGAISDFGWVNTGTGWVPVPSSDVKDRIEDNVLLEMSWFARNYLTPMFIGGQEERIRPSFLDPEYSHYVAPLNEWREGTWTRPGGYRTGGGF